MIIFYSSMVDLQCVSFWCTAKHFGYIYIQLYFLKIKGPFLFLVFFMATLPTCGNSWATPLSMGSQVVSMPWLLQTVLQWTSEDMCLFESWFSLDRCPGAGLLDQMVILFLVFRGISVLFSTVVTLIYIPTSSVIGYPFLHTLSSVYRS